MQGEVLGVERRRRWGDDQKLAIVSSVGVDGATVTQVAQRHEITRQQVYTWRHELKKKGLWSGDHGVFFLPINVPAMDATSAADPAACAQVEVRLGKGRCLRFDSALDTAVLTQLIRAVELA